VSPDAAAADRRHRVREAARAWHRAGAIDDAARTAVGAAYPDDRARLSPAFRALVFFFTVVAAGAVFAVVALSVGRTGERGLAGLLVFFGLVMVVATEVQIGPLRRAEGGSEDATALLAVVWLLGGIAWLLDDMGVQGDRWVNLTLVQAALLGAAAAWRWGYALFAAGSAVALFLLAARAPFGRRILWILAGLALAPVLAHASERVSLCPAHRRSARAVAAVALVCLYLAVHRGSWDVGWVELMAGRPHERSDSTLLRLASTLATALVPLLVFAWGLRTRRRWLIGLGVAGAMASLVTLRFYVHVAPLWVVLIGGGVAALALAAVLRRYLESGTDGERNGFTAAALFAPPGSPGLLELAVAAAAAQPAARPPGTPPELQPGGGRYGGGGASGSY
jgi:hypothetical protein